MTDEQANQLLDGDIVDGWRLVEENILGHGRWDLDMQNVYRRGNGPDDFEYYVVEYSRGATENQDYGPYLGSHGPAKLGMKVVYGIVK